MSSEVGSLVAKGNELMPPPPPRQAKRKREQVVLDEDEWTEQIEAIIQRDYFPDLPKLENELEWLEAVRTRDPTVIRQAQANIAQRRAGLRTPMGQSPATFATPLIGFRTPDFAATPATQAAQASGREDGGKDASTSAAPKMSLDQFMAKHTSEDNASFGEILEGINKRRRERYAWVHGGSKGDQTKLLEDSRPQDGYGTSGQPSGALLTWPYQPKNGLYYERDAVALTEKELSLQVQGPPKQISAPNTRLPGSDIDDASMERVQKAVRGDGYQPVATPSFTPGPDESPFMTWGELEATPLRLETDDSVPKAAAMPGPQFTVPARKPKDILAHRLADGARLNLQKRAALMSPSLLRNLHGKTPRLRSKLGLGASLQGHGQRSAMSPAAHRLASSLRGRGDTPADRELRASYSKSALRTPRPDTGMPAATPAPAAPSETPAILHGEPEGSPSAPASPRAREETPFREAALKAFEQSLARKEAIKAFEEGVTRKQALQAFGKITDNLLNF